MYNKNDVLTKGRLMDHYFTNNQDLKSEIKKLNYSFSDYNFEFISDNGVFSKDHIDYGSIFLVETFLKSDYQKGSVLDIGCGYGFIGCTIGKILDTKVTFTDINKRALHLTKLNIKNNKINGNVIESNAYENITEKFDIIITNPPVRAGKKTLLDILIGAKDHLEDNGTLYYVLRKDQGAKSIKKNLENYYKVDILGKSKGFYIFFCKSIDN